MTQQVATLKETTKTFGDLLDKYKSTFSDLLPKHLSIDRMFRLGTLAMSRQPLLAQCSMASLLSAMMKSAEMGLEPDGTKAALVPFRNNKTGKMEATLIPMWQGLAELVRGTGQIAALDTDIVCEYDKFIFVKGLEPKLEHTPAMRGDRGEMIGAWAMVRYREGGSDQEWMSKEEIDRIKSRSKAKDYGPWVTDYFEMSRKTVFKRLCKRLPKSTSLIIAMDAENRFEEGEVVDLVSLSELPQEALPEPEKTATEKLAEKTRKPRSDKGQPRKQDLIQEKEPPEEYQPHTKNILSPNPVETTGEQGSKPTGPGWLVDPDTAQEINLYCKQLGLNPDATSQNFREDKGRGVAQMTNSEAGAMLGWLLDQVAVAEK